MWENEVPIRHVSLIERLLETSLDGPIDSFSCAITRGVVGCGPRFMDSPQRTYVRECNRFEVGAMIGETAEGAKHPRVAYMHDVVILLADSARALT